MTGNWNLEEVRLKPLTAEYFEVFKDVGESRFSRGVTAVIHNGKFSFFPSIAEFRGFVPSAGRWTPCGKCESGFIRVPDKEAEMLYGDPTATKMIFCQCRYSNVGVSQ